MIDSRGQDVRIAAARWRGALGTFAVFLAIRAMLGDPASPWWSVAVVTCLGLLTAATAAWLAAPGYLYGAGLLINLAATLWYAVEGRTLGGGSGLLGLPGLLEVNATALALPGLAWLVLDRQRFQRLRGAGTSGPTPFHRVALAASTVLVVAVAVFGLWGALTGTPNPTSVWLDLAAVGSAAALTVGCCVPSGSGRLPAFVRSAGFSPFPPADREIRAEARTTSGDAATGSELPQSHGTPDPSAAVEFPVDPDASPRPQACTSSASRPLHSASSACNWSPAGCSGWAGFRLPHTRS